VFVALGVQHAMRMHLIVLSSVACSAVQYFYTLFHKRQDFREKSYWTQNVDFPYNFSEKFLIRRRNERDVILYVHNSSSKMLVILLRF